MELRQSRNFIKIPQKLFESKSRGSSEKKRRKSKKRRNSTDNASISTQSSDPSNTSSTGAANSSTSGAHKNVDVGEGAFGGTSLRQLVLLTIRLQL